MFAGPLLPLTVLTGMAPGLPWCIDDDGQLVSDKRATVAASGLVPVRRAGHQRRQPAGGAKPQPQAVFRVAAVPEHVQWGPLMMFLIVFVIGLAVVAWMLAQALKCRRRPKWRKGRQPRRRLVSG